MSTDSIAGIHGHSESREIGPRFFGSIIHVIIMGYIEQIRDLFHIITIVDYALGGKFVCI